MKALVVYYSLEGSTRRIAEQIADELSADLLEIKPCENFQRRLVGSLWWGASVLP
jgi:flavodoxin